MNKVKVVFQYLKNKIKKNPKLYTIVFTLIIGILVGLWINRSSSYKPINESRLVDFSLKDVGKLVTQEGCYTSVQTLGDSRFLLGLEIPFTQKKYVYSLDGVVSAGINFAEIELQENAIDNVLTVILPPSEIFSVTPNEDSFTIYHEGDNPFNGLHLDEINESRAAMEKEIRDKALSYGILDHATDNAKVIVTSLLRQVYNSDTWKVEFKTKGGN